MYNVNMMEAQSFRTSGNQLDFFPNLDFLIHVTHPGVS
jgi:hypothetical protein